MITSNFYDEAYYERGQETGKNIMQGPYSWDRLEKYFTQSAKHMLNLFTPKTSIDIGCGKGFMVKALQDLGVDAMGVDWSEYAVDNRHPDTKEGSVFLCDIKDLYMNRKFDLVTCFDMLEHIQEKDLDLVLESIFDLAANYVVLNIGVSELPDIDKDISHVNIQNRTYWINKLREQKNFIILNNNRFVVQDIWWFNVPNSLFVLQKF